MKVMGLSIGILVLLPTLVLAGPNAGGVLLVHSANLTYEGINECGRGSAPDSCGAVVSEIDNATSDSLKVWKVYAAFPPGSSPRLKGLTFGIDYDDSYGDSTGVVIRSLGPCADFELAMNGWPGDSTGTSILWNSAQTGLMTECYWFAGYNYYGNPATFALIPHPEQGGYFIDDSKPGQMDPIADYGSLGFGQPGYVPSCAIGGGDSDNNAAPNAPSSGPPSGAGPDNAGGQMAVSFLASAVPDTIYIDPGPNDTLQVQLTSEDTACTIQLRTRIQRTGAVVNTQTISLSANTAALSSKIPFSRQNGLALVELTLTHGSSSRLLVECPDNDTITFNGAPVELYNGPLTFYVPQGADSLCLRFPPHEAGGQFWLTYPGLGGWIQGYSGGNDTLAVLPLPPEAAGCAWTLALASQDWSLWGAFQTRFHFPGIRDTPAPHLFDSWFRPDFSFSYGWNLDSPPALPPAQLYDPQAVAGADSVKYYFPKLQDPSTTPYPYSADQFSNNPDVVFSGPQWFTFYNWPRADHTTSQVGVRTYGGTIDVESWTTNRNQRTVQAASGTSPITITFSNIVHVRVMTAESRFGIATDAAGAVCGPTPAFSWKGLNPSNQPYAPWSYFYVPDDRTEFAVTFQVTARNISVPYTYQYYPTAELIIRDPTDAVVDSVAANGTNGDRVVERVLTGGHPSGLWSFRVRSPQNTDKNNPPELEVAFDDSLPAYATWLDPHRFFMPTTMPGQTRMGRQQITERWNIGIPLPYVCLADITGSGQYATPTASEQSVLESGVGKATRLAHADTLGLWGAAQRGWTRRSFVADTAAFYIVKNATYLSRQGAYLDPRTMAPSHIVELCAGSSHCDLKGTQPYQYNQDTCGVTIGETATAGWPATYAKQHTGPQNRGGYTASHAMKFGHSDDIFVNSRLDPAYTAQNVPDYQRLDWDLDSLSYDAGQFGNLWSYETNDWLTVDGYDRDWMLEAAYHIRLKDSDHPIDLGEGPTDLKMSRELKDIADVRSAWSYPIMSQQNCQGDTTCRPLCDIIHKWDDLAAERWSDATFVQGLALYHQAGFGGTKGYVVSNPDSAADQALASLALGAGAVREWRRYVEPDSVYPQYQVKYDGATGQALWRAMSSKIPGMLNQAATWLDTQTGVAPTFGRAGRAATLCGGPPIVWGTGTGYWALSPPAPYGIWFVICDLGAAGPDTVRFSWSQMHGFPPGSYTPEGPYTDIYGPDPVWNVSSNGLQCVLYGSHYSVAFLPWPGYSSVEERNSELLQMTVSPVPVTGTARVHFYSRIEGREEAIVTDVAGRDVLRKEIATQVGWNDWIWNGELDRGRAASGVYFLRLRGGDGKETRRRLVVCR